ncbi:MAG: hypothetical protein R2733_17090 [Acidimicrobiales bacterium]
MHDEIVDPEDRRQHLEFIQSVITRMSASSSTAKGWLLPVVTATYGYALTKHADSVALLGVAAVVVFAMLDANYLNQERLFRELYDRVANGDPVPKYSMKPLSSTAEGADDTPRRDGKARWLSVPRGWFPPRRVWLSWAVAPFYGSFVAVGLAIAVRTR